MFSPRTVFILGAGASHDFGLPTGDLLRGKLITALQTDPLAFNFDHTELNHAVHGLCQRELGADRARAFSLYADAAERIRTSLPMAMSIDNLLHAHRNDERMVRLGKLAIAAVILESERISGLNLPRGVRQRGEIQYTDINIPRVEESWYLPLMRLLTTGRTVEEVGEIFESVAFIIFNYDRCLEHFLSNALINYFHVNDRAAIEAINRLTIIHPYGQVGHLRWQHDATITSSFGSADGHLIEIADQILTFTESANEGVTESVRELVSGAATLVFMGFGFLPQNMELLTAGRQSSVRRVFATTMGIGDSDVDVAVAAIGAAISSSLNLDDTGFDHRGHFRPFVERGSCRELMDHHWLRLTRNS